MSMSYIHLEQYARLDHIVIYEARTFSSYIHIELLLLRRPPPLPLPFYLDVAAQATVHFACLDALPNPNLAKLPRFSTL
jgi:hypothetical protein